MKFDILKPQKLVKVSYKKIKLLFLIKVMENSQKGFIVQMVLIIIVLLAIGRGVYVYENKSTEVPAPVIVETRIKPSNQNQQKVNSKTPPAVTEVMVI